MSMKYKETYLQCCIWLYPKETIIPPTKRPPYNDDINFYASFFDVVSVIIETKHLKGISSPIPTTNKLITAIAMEELKTRAKEPAKASPKDMIKTFFLLILLMKKLTIKRDMSIPIDRAVL